MIIHQVLPTIAYGDAVSNEAFMLQKLLKNAGHLSNIFALNIDARVKNRAYKLDSQMNHLAKADHIIYHFSIGSPALDQIMTLSKPKMIMRYHNITPGRFFSFFAPEFKIEVDTGRLQLQKSLKKFSRILADSEYNKQDLVGLGYPEDLVKVIPVLIDFDQYNRQQDLKMKSKMQDGKTNILFVGRIAPNKCHEDLIKTAYYYGKYYNSNFRLILAGSTQFSLYSEMLANLVLRLGMGDAIYFTGHIKFEELLAIYQSADVFLSMSEHEGFCVPILESMYFQVPVIAYRSSALPETVGESSLLLDEKDHRIAAASINRIVTDSVLSRQIIANQNEHLERFKGDKVYSDFCSYIEELK